MSLQNEMTVPDISVGADMGQPSLSTLNEDTDDIIHQDEEIINNSDKDIGDFDFDFGVYDTWGYDKLSTVSMSELFENVYRSKPPIIDGLLYRGLYIFAGAPKLGKSFLMSQLAYHISTGTSMWNYTVHKGTVLYLALEDDLRRLQERMYRMFGTAQNENLYFSVSADKIGGSLEDQLAGFVAEHTKTSLIIIDTLQKVRECKNDNYSYASDYDIIAKMKSFADKNCICMILVHHTRKQDANDKFDMISGTNGLLGAADGAFVLVKEKRTSNAAVLDISGRDQQDQKLYLNRNPDTLIWDLDKTETELWKEPPDPFLDKISDWLSANGNKWSGSPTGLVQALDLELKPNTLTQKLNVNADRLFNEYKIIYKSTRSHEGRKISLSKSLA